MKRKAEDGGIELSSLVAVVLLFAIGFSPVVFVLLKNFAPGVLAGVDSFFQQNPFAVVFAVLVVITIPFAIAAYNTFFRKDAD